MIAPRLEHRPALDGLRGAAVAAVVAFHLGYGWAKGGYLGVSVFFTLSGFLITSLLLAERRSTGGTDVARFWARRARRLLPAALAGIILAALVARTLRTAPPGTAVDLLAALGDVANWRFLAAGRSYGSLFTSPSPVLHFWSLAVEAQLYLLLPLGFVVLYRRGGERALRRGLLAAIALSWLALVASGLLGQRDLAYYSTFTRAGELLAGAALALGWRRPSHAARRARPWVELAALGALVVLVTSLSPRSRLLELGGLPLTAGLSALVVVGAQRDGALAKLLSWGPLVRLGRVSYGVYVYHWPLLLWLTPARTGLHGATLDGLRVAATLLVATLSFFVLERPIREGRWPSTARVRVALPGVAGATVVLVLLLSAGIRPSVDFGAANAEVAGAAAAGSSATGVRVAFFGDSTALMVALGVARWGLGNGQLRLVAQDTPLGCSISRGGARAYQGGKGPSNALCDQWAQRWPAILDARPADVAVVMEGPWEVADRTLPGDPTWRRIGDPAVDRYVQDEIGAAVDLLLQRVGTVVLVTSPDIDTGAALADPPASPFPESDPARMARFNDILRAVAQARERVTVVDLNAHLRSLPGGEMDPALRPDGIHFTPQTTDIVAPWIAQAILAARQRP